MERAPQVPGGDSEGKFSPQLQAYRATLPFRPPERSPPPKLAQEDDADTPKVMGDVMGRRGLNLGQDVLRLFTLCLELATSASARMLV